MIEKIVKHARSKQENATSHGKAVITADTER